MPGRAEPARGHEVEQPGEQLPPPLAGEHILARLNAPRLEALRQADPLPRVQRERAPPQGVQRQHVLLDVLDAHPALPRGDVGGHVADADERAHLLDLAEDAPVS